MSDRLPAKLGKSPLIDALFEVQFDGASSLSSILTGITFAEFDCTNIEKLPHAELPESVRANDPNLRHAILQRLTWGKYLIGIGDHAITLAARPPYRGWAEFKEKILEILAFIEKQKLIKSVQRFSLKYIDILTDDIHTDIHETLNIQFSLGSNKPDPDTIYMRAEVPFESGTHILQIVGNINATIPIIGEKQGILVDIDSIYPVSTEGLKEAVTLVKSQLDNLHLLNKGLFFDILSQQGLDKLEPTYD